MFVTVAICTWNRSALLDRTLAEMRNLRTPPGVGWELLVVNNNCTDDTGAVIARHAAHLPVRELHEPKQGHSHARNCAVAAARGELLIWTDDDVLVEPDWLAEYVKAAEVHPDYDYFGGTVDPWYEVDPPRWVRGHIGQLAGPYVIFQHGSEVRPLREAEGLAGASLAFRTAVLSRFPFNPQFGRVKSQLVGNDDCDVVDRVRKAGHRGLWVGTARVRHFIPASRLTKRYVWDWFRGGGQTAVRMHGVQDCPSWLGAPRWAWVRYAAARLRAGCLAPTGGKGWFRAFREAAQLRGLIEECRARPMGAVAHAPFTRPLSANRT